MVARRVLLTTALMMLLGACAIDSGDAEPSGSAATPSSTTSSVPAVDGSANTTTTSTHASTTTTTTIPEEEAEAELDLDPALRTVEVIMTEMAFEPAGFRVAAGETVQFVLRNQGAVEHEFRLTTMHAAEEHIASGHEGHDDEGGHSHDEMSVVVQPGAVTVFVANFEEAGAFDIVACLLPGHFEAGMHAPLSYES